VGIFQFFNGENKLLLMRWWWILHFTLSTWHVGLFFWC